MPAPAPPAPGFGEFLRDRRTQLGLSAEQVAQACDVDQSTVSRWEHGSSLTKVPKRASALAGVLEVDVETLRDLWWRTSGGWLPWMLDAA